MTASKSADSHGGMHGDFVVFWSVGWYYLADDGSNAGPFETSQAAFCARKAAIDADEIRVVGPSKSMAERDRRGWPDS